jgi:pyruvate formate lyase activating enzyme
MKSALLFDIKRYALHDGPNIRTTVFFKGCPLNCFWCHNPEGISPQMQVVFVPDKCIGCRECLQECPESALTLGTEGIIRNQGKCSVCLACVEICPSLAQEATGWRGDVDMIMAEIRKDLPFYDTSGGGVTFSGGEPLAQAEVLLALLQECGRLGIHRAVDTTGCAQTGTLREIARHTELFLYDLKHMDTARHKEYTGVANELILHNLKVLGEMNVAIRVRIPLLAGINDDGENIRAIGAFVARISAIEGIDILPYHHSATAKYTKLNMSYHGERNHIPSRESILRVQRILESFGHEVRIGG